MSGQITISIWLFLFFILVFAIALLDRILIPSTRWFLRRRINAVIEEIGTRLDIEMRPFQLTKRQVLIDRLCYDPKVIKTIKSYAKENDMPIEMVQKKVISYAKEIVPSFNAYFYFRIGYWIAKKIARLLYRVRVGLFENDQYKNIDPDSTVVFIMNHRSNIDYILVSFLAAERTTLSYAVGEWAKIWPLHMLFRFMGAFFVRRNSGNALYRRVLERYIHMATQQGVCQAVFLEGGLSKDGKLQKPRLGLIDYMLRSFDPKKDQDIIFIPVGINYDRTIEDRSLLRSLNSDVKKRSLWFIFKTSIFFILRNFTQMLLSRWHRFGYACVNFGNPISTIAYSKKHEIVFKNLPRKQRFPEIKKLCDTLINKISAVVPIVPVSIVSQFFLENLDKELTFLDIENGCGSILQKIKIKGAPVIETAHSTRKHAISEAISLMLLRDMIKEADGLFTCNDTEIRLLQYYANTLNQWL
ncbi:MAG: 1-acyl-sn-glycerol-3-phosphate acyltransferase [Desulfobacula sp.]|uniref:1-acyl-sn-glycerol-3-phosphate acyltransferase n=1 Tax=Desulfobacula sp. TaxID=2593537 RepID=UPI0025C4B90E|nr:1-acyl-sn-glycerol-3-phosphate acyltransferase [Desulfobacula sp.]MCD4721247.1 1-acyl-sn-glycerol-3-phosphate acyltransferase [Desulfobacula sp.]